LFAAIRNDLNTSTIFQPRLQPLSDILTSVSNNISSLPFPVRIGSLKLPDYTALIKLHKPVPAPRFIVSAADVVTTPAQKLLGVILKALDPFLLDLLRSLFSRIPSFPWHGLSPILSNTIDVVSMMKAFNRMKDTYVLFMTGDVSRLYTNIPLDTLKSRLKHLYALLFALFFPGLKVFPGRKKNVGEWLRQAVPDNREHRSGGGRRNTDKFYIYTYEDVCLLLDLVIDNNY
jgi:hypothetical protein